MTTTQGSIADDRITTMSVNGRRASAAQILLLVVLCTLVLTAGIALAVIAWVVALPLLAAGLIWLAATRDRRPVARVA